MRTSLCLYAFFLLFPLTACQHQPHAYSPVPSKGAQLDGFDGIPFHMPYHQAYQQLVARKIRVTPTVSGTPSLSYDTRLDTHPVRTILHFSSHEQVHKIQLVALEGYQVATQEECDALYRRFVQSYRALYGRPDSIARNLPQYEPQCRAQLRYSFANSSFIDIHEQYRPGASPACHIQAFYNPNWATLCLVTNQRFCDFSGNFMPLDE